MMNIYTNDGPNPPQYNHKKPHTTPTTVIPVTFTPKDDTSVTPILESLSTLGTSRPLNGDNDDLLLTVLIWD